MAWLDDNNDTLIFDKEHVLTKEDSLAYLASDEPLSYQDTTDGNLLAKAYHLKYGEKCGGIYLTRIVSKYNYNSHTISHGWPADLMREAIAVEEALESGLPPTREHLSGHLPSIGY